MHQMSYKHENNMVAKVEQLPHYDRHLEFGQALSMRRVRKRDVSVRTKQSREDHLTERSWDLRRINLQVTFVLLKL